MKIIFVSNSYNHHQRQLCNFIKELNDDFIFIQICSNGDLGYQKPINDYFVRLYDAENKNELEDLILNKADIVIFGSAPFSLFRKRLRLNKITFLWSEHIFKKIPNDFFNYRKLYIFLNFAYARLFKKSYILCSSAYLSKNLKSLFFPQKRLLKWGYFPDYIEHKSTKVSNTILWCGRFIYWKHPEYAVEIARMLKEDNISFNLKMIGSGDKENEILDLIIKYNLQKEVTLLGSMNATEVRNIMLKSQVFLLTSDLQEGWGAVLNEAMNSSCAVVASKSAGSSLFLINDKVNGFLYENSDIAEAFEKVKLLLCNPSLCTELGLKAYQTICSVWNAKIAAERFINLCKSISSDDFIQYEEGPCSKI